MRVWGGPQLLGGHKDHSLRPCPWLQMALAFSCYKFTLQQLPNAAILIPHTHKLVLLHQAAVQRVILLNSGHARPPLQQVLGQVTGAWAHLKGEADGRCI